MPPQQRYDRSDIRRLNAISVLNQLRIRGAMSRANISSVLGLTRATVSNIVADLLAASLVSETGYIEGGAGRPGLLIELNPDCGSMVAVEIDLDRISIILSNVGLETLWREDVSFGMNDSPTGVLAGAASLVEQALGKSQDIELECAGICVAWAGLVDSDAGRLAYGPTSGWEDVRLKDDWEARFSVPVYIENEAHAGAIGAHHFGPTQGTKNLIYLSLGVGLAAGVFSDGVLLRGKQGFAGQVGHTRFAGSTAACVCGKTGCWVAEVGASAVSRRLIEAGVKIPLKTTDSGGDWLELIYDKASSGDAETLRVLRETGALVGKGLAQMIQTFNPSVLIVGGRMGKLMKFAEASIDEGIKAETLDYMTSSLQLIISDSGEDQLRGCLAAVYDSLMNNPVSARNTN